MSNFIDISEKEKKRSVKEKTIKNAIKTQKCYLCHDIEKRVYIYKYQKTSKMFSVRYDKSVIERTGFSFNDLYTELDDEETIITLEKDKIPVIVWLEELETMI